MDDTRTEGLPPVEEEPRDSGPPPEAPGPSPPPADSGNPSYVYAIGRVEPRFPSPGVEREFAQATGRAQTDALTDREALRTLLGERQNRYLARQLCCVLTIQGLETYLLPPP